MPSSQPATSVQAAEASLIDSGDAIELVFGLVGPTGVDLTKVCESLSAQLKTVGYDTRIVTLSELILPYIGRSATFQNEYARIDGLMTEGTNLRRDTQQGT